MIFPSCAPSLAPLHHTHRMLALVVWAYDDDDDDARADDVPWSELFECWRGLLFEFSQIEFLAHCYWMGG